MTTTLCSREVPKSRLLGKVSGLDNQEVSKNLRGCWVRRCRELEWGSTWGSPRGTALLKTCNCGRKGGRGVFPKDSAGSHKSFPR